MGKRPRTWRNAMSSWRETLPSFLYTIKPLTHMLAGRPRIRAREAGAYSLTLAFAIVIVGVVLRWHITALYEEQISAWRSRQSGVVDDQAQMVSDWLKERQGDARVFAASHSVSALLRAHYASRNEPANRAAALAVADEMTKSYPYSGVYILDRDAQVVLHSSRSIPLDP